MEGAVAGLGAIEAALGAVGEAVALGGLWGVELAVAAGEDGDGDAGEGPVDDVEVVGGLVDEEAAGVVFVAVPAAEVVGAVADVEEPVEVH